MGRRQDVVPYRGSALLTNTEADGWVLRIRSWPGARTQFLLPAGDVFDGNILTAHLLGEGFENIRVRVAKDSCHIEFLAGGVSPRRAEAKLLGVLRRRYSHYKGRPIQWARN